MARPQNGSTLPALMAFFVLLNLVAGYSFGAFGQTQLERQTDDARGYWWYEDPHPEGDVRTAEKPDIPSLEQLRQMHPEDFQELITAQLNYALVDQTTESVGDFYRLVDFARRQSRSFAALHGQVLLESPELNPHTAYPTTNAGRTAQRRTREQNQQDRLLAERGEFAIVMFSLEGCGFCDAQWAVLQHFRERTGWQIVRLDMHEHAEKAARFNVNSAPVTVMLRHGGRQWANVAVGAQSLPSLMEATHRQIRVLKGEIDPGQFYTDPHDQGGFFDPRQAAFMDGGAP
jgi:conjugal transfer pilus assembly protein TraF